MTKPEAFHVSHASDAEFKAGGLRSFFEYRDLGISKATGGRCMAQVIRARAGGEGHTGRHYHELECQLVYILKGWITFDYEDVGEVRLEAGSCVNQPPGIRHSEIDHSEDLELLEVTIPAEFTTVSI